MDLLPPLVAPGYEIADAPQLVEPENHFNKPLRAEKDVMEDIPQPKDVHGESSHSLYVHQGYYTSNSAGISWVWGQDPLSSTDESMEEAEASANVRIREEAHDNAPKPVRSIGLWNL